MDELAGASLRALPQGQRLLELAQGHGLTARPHGGAMPAFAA